MPVIPTKTTYLQMFAPVETELAAPRPDAQVVHCDDPSVELYRSLYRGVGAAFHWVDRLRMSETDLQAIIQDDQVDIYILYVAQQPAGYSELDRRRAGEIELAYFGLFPEVIGQGLGKYLLNSTLQKAWQYNPRRVWLHTCDLDHPAALPNYLKAGFQIYGEAMVDQWVPETS